MTYVPLPIRCPSNPGRDLDPIARGIEADRREGDRNDPQIARDRRLPDPGPIGGGVAGAGVGGAVDHERLPLLRLHGEEPDVGELGGLGSGDGDGDPRAIGDLDQAGEGGQHGVADLALEAAALDLHQLIAAAGHLEVGSADGRQLELELQPPVIRAGDADVGSGPAILG